MKTTCLALLALLSVGLTACGDETANASPSTSLTPSAAARPQPKPTTDRTRVDNYTSVVEQGTGRLARAQSSSGTHCGNGDLPMCRLALGNVASASEQFLSDLDMNPAPTCVEAADVELRAALKDYREGARLAIHGIDITDATLIKQGSDKTAQATAHMKRSADLLRDVHC